MTLVWCRMVIFFLLSLSKCKVTTPQFSPCHHDTPDESISNSNKMMKERDSVRRRCSLLSRVKLLV